MEKKENKVTKVFKNAWCFVKEHKKAVTIGAASVVGVGLGTAFIGWLKHQESASEELAAEIDPEGEHGIANVWKDSGVITVLFDDDGNLEANQLADRFELMYGQYGIDEHTPITALVDFDISNNK